MKSLTPEHLSLLVLRVPSGYAGIEVPAVSIEWLGDRFNLSECLLLDLLETDDDIGHLNTGVVDVVLDFDALTYVAENPDECICETWEIWCICAAWRNGRR